MALSQSLGSANGILDRLGGRASVTDHRDPVDTEQRRTPKLGIIDPALQLYQWSGDQGIGQAPPKRSRDFLEQQLFDGIGHAFRNTTTSALPL